MKPKMTLLLAMLAFAAVMALGATAILFAAPVLAAAPPPAAAALDGNAIGIGMFSAALATGMSSLGAGLAVGKLGTAAVGALTEKPELLGRLLILVGLAEGIAIYGLIVSILILNRLA
ncbi:MAG: H+transporting two-sector ATPase C subunit [Rhodocyclaceae bacterium]|nr:MAG: H+transporting two-sector ATPase C subunit [Rhodocyclaceae bacterium]